VVYEIGISFQDSDGDGKGDLGGLLRRLDYLRWLGIDAVWLTPIFCSPSADFGYDIADFCAVDRTLGTIDQVRRADRTTARGGHPPDPRFRAQSHLQPARLVQGEPLVARQPAPRLVCLG
jgi:hypothetical protein